MLEANLLDKIDRTFVLFLLADLQAKVYDRNSYVFISGVKAMELFVDRLPQTYDWIVNAWKNPDSQDHKNAMEAYKMWLQDRFVHGREEIVRQFSGECPFQQEGTIDDFLNKNFFAWKFAKFPYAYLRGRASYGPDFYIPNYGEWAMYGYELPLAYKSVGIPSGMIGIESKEGFVDHLVPSVRHHSMYEYAIFGIPEDVIDKLLSQKNLGRIAIAPGNGISLYSCIDGVEKPRRCDTFYA